MLIPSGVLRTQTVYQKSHMHMLIPSGVLRTQTIGNYMGLFNRVKNIIKSNINFKNEVKLEDIDTSDYDEVYYDDVKEVPKDNKEEKYYGILELEYGAGFKEIKASYKRLLKKYHPDLYYNDTEKQKTAQKITEKLNEAYTYFERKYL